MRKEINIQIQEAKKTPIMKNPDRPLPRLILTKLSKPKTKRETWNKTKEVTHHVQEASIKLSMDFSEETLKAREEWDDKFKSFKKKKFPTKNTITSKTILQK